MAANELDLGSFQSDPQRRRDAKRYAAIRRRLYLLDLGIGAAFGLVVLFGGIATALRSFLGSFAGQPLLVALMFLALSIAYGLILWPLSYYSGFRLAHRFGLSTQRFRAWLWDWLKGGLLGLCLGLVVVEVVYYLLGTFPETWWLWAAGAMLLFTVVLANLSPVIFVPLFYKLTPLRDEDLARRLLILAERAGTRVRGVFTMDMSSKTTAANAALMGLGNTRRIVLGDTLLAHYDAEEIETVLAHELGHHVHGDIPKGIAVQTALILAGFYLVHLTLRSAIDPLGYFGLADVAGMPLLALVFGAFGVITMPLSNGFSRLIEGQADAYALESTGKAGSFARAMYKLGDQNLSEPDPPRWVELLLYDHPATHRRIARAREYARLEASTGTASPPPDQPS